MMINYVASNNTLVPEMNSPELHVRYGPGSASGAQSRSCAHATLEGSQNTRAKVAAPVTYVAPDRSVRNSWKSVAELGLGDTTN